MDRKKLQKSILENSFKAGACHIGSALSCVDILLKTFNILKDEDVFIFGKASGVVAYYTMLADEGHFPEDKIWYYLKFYPLPSVEVPGVVHSFGSLGHALPVACGMAYTDRSRKVYVLISDAECQEGTTYESALFARQHKLDNLHVIVDANGLQACGDVASILDLSKSYHFFENTFPNFHFHYTTKGEGVDFMENNYHWHYQNLTKELLEKALCQI